MDPLRSFIFVCLIMFLTFSFWRLRWSALAHHAGRLYSHLTHRLIQALQAGCFSSHFLRRRRQVKQPYHEKGLAMHEAEEVCRASMSPMRCSLPERDRLCILTADFSIVPTGVPSLEDDTEESMLAFFIATLAADDFFFDAAGIVACTRRHYQNASRPAEVIAKDRTQSSGKLCGMED